MKKIISTIPIILLIWSCNFFSSDSPRKAIAKVNDSYLYEDEITDLVTEGTSKADSILRVNDYINRWARQKLLMQGAIENLPKEKLDEFSVMVEQYKTDLYTKAYIEALVKKSIDTIVTKDQALAFYKKNKESFRLNDNLIKFRYISTPLNTLKIEAIKNRFLNFKPQNKKYLDSLSVQFTSYNLNDTIWVKLSDIYNKIPVFNEENKDKLLNKTNFLEIKDSLNIYLVTVKDVLKVGNYSPLEYILPTLKKIVINKRKLDLINKLENDIIKDAIKNKQFKTYN